MLTAPHVEELLRRAEAADGATPDGDAGRVLAVHFGRSANCSSIGSFVDYLFLSAVLGAAVLTAVAVLVRARGRDEEDRDDRGP